MTYQIATVLLVFLAFIVSILSGKVKIHVAAMMIPVVLEVSGVLSFKDAWSGLTNSSVIMMASMFIVGAAVGKTSLISRMSKALIKPGSSDFKIMLGLTVPVLFLGCFVSPVATLTIMVPIVTAVCAEQQRPISKFMYPTAALCVYWAGFLPTGGNAGGYLANNAVIENLGGVGTFNYFTIMISKIPFVLLGFVLTLIITLKMAPDHGNVPTLVDANAVTDHQKPKSHKGRLTPGKEKFAILVFVATIIGIVACALCGVSTWYPSTVAALILVFSGVLSDRESITAMTTPTIFITAGTLPLSTALKVTGADVLIADTFANLTGGASPIVIMAILYLVCMLLTQFMSNGSVNNAFKTLAALIAVQGGYDARAMMICTSQGSAAAFLTPMANPSMTLAYETGGYKLKDFIRMGSLHLLLNFVTFMVYIPTVFPLR